MSWIVEKEENCLASSGNRTRAARVAGEHSTTEPTMPLLQLHENLSVTLQSIYRFCFSSPTVHRARVAQSVER